LQRREKYDFTGSSSLIPSNSTFAFRGDDQQREFARKKMTLVFYFATEASGMHIVLHVDAAIRAPVVIPKQNNQRFVSFFAAIHFKLNTNSNQVDCWHESSPDDKSK
jgi:hypothetical protein